MWGLIFKAFVKYLEAHPERIEELVELGVRELVKWLKSRVD